MISLLRCGTVLRTFLPTLFFLFCVSCLSGGGGGGSGGTTNGASQSEKTSDAVFLAAKAGSDQTVILGRYIILDGSKSTGNGSLTYTWTVTQCPSGSAAVPANNTATPAFTPDVAGDYTIRLVVTDSQGQPSEPDELTVHALPNSTSVDATLAWDASNSVGGYKVYYGTESGIYQYVEDIGNVTTYRVTNLVGGIRYYFAVTAYAGNQESGFSNEVSFLNAG